MKKLLVLAFLFVMTSSFAQHEAKLNLTGFIYGDVGGAYEYVFSKKSSINTSVSYMPYILYKKGADVFSLFSMSVEYRSYLKEKDVPATGFWIAPYVKYNRLKWGKDNPVFLFFKIIFANLEGELEDDEAIFNAVSAGVSSGYKANITSKIYIEGYLGAGLRIYNNMMFHNLETGEYTSGRSEKMKFTGRIGINIGYRFGEKK